MGNPTLLAFWSPGPWEMMLLAVVALLLYGGKLPEVARSWGKTFAEFRRSLNSIQNDINVAINSEPDQLEYRPDASTSYDDSYVDPDYPEGDDYSDSTEDEVESAEEATAIKDQDSRD